MPVSSIIISTKSKRAITVSEIGLVQIWSYGTGDVLKVLKGYPGRLDALAGLTYDIELNWRAREQQR